MGLLVSLVISTLAVLVSGYILPGVHIEDFPTAVVLAIILGVMNTVLKPILVILTLPLTILSLGLFIFVINGLIILLAAKIVPGFKVDNFWWALLFSLLTAIIGAFLHSLTK